MFVENGRVGLRRIDDLDTRRPVAPPPIELPRVLSPRLIIVGGLCSQRSDVPHASPFAARFALAFGSR